MRLLGLLIVLSGCATAPLRHAETFVKHGHRFEGERWVVLTGSDDDVTALENILLKRGFRVSRGITDVQINLPTRYVAHIKGVCAGYVRARAGDYSGVPQPIGVRVDVFDSRSSERVMSARVDDDDDCPRAFFQEVAEALERNWEHPPPNAPWDGVYR